MKIALFSENFYPALSGISDSIMLLAQELSGHGHHVRFYVPTYAQRDYRRGDTIAPEYAPGGNIEVIRFPSLSFPPASEQRRVVIPIGRAWFSLRKWKPDIIHTQLCFGMGMEALIAAKLLKVPLIGTNHTPLSEFIHYNPIQGKWVTRLVLKYVSWYYNQCRYVTAPSDFLFPEMIRHGFKQPHRALSNPVDTVRFHPPTPERREEIRRKLGVSGPVLIYTGRLSPEKHVDVCLRAFAEVRRTVPDASFFVIGQGAAQDDLKKLAQELNLGESVRFLGFVGSEEIVHFYQGADVFAIASTAETQCLSMMQAFACGLPAVAADAGGLPEFLPPEAGFLIKPGDVAALAEKLTMFMTNAEARHQYGARALSYVQKFSAPHIMDEWVALYSANSFR